MNIDARKYYRVGKQRLREAQLVLTRGELPAAAQYLGGYAVECILKALVIVATPQGQRPPSGEATIQWLKREFGHSLSALRTGVHSRIGNIPHEIVGAFILVLTWDPELRYEPGPGDPEEAEGFLAAAAAIVDWADGRM